MTQTNTSSLDQKAERLPPREVMRDSGILVVDKPAGMTSMDVIRNLRRVVYAKRIGHGGTLDPFATGVLPIMFNDATKLSAKVMDGMKDYEGTLYLGLSFDTQDMTGKPIQDEMPVSLDLNLKDLQNLAATFQGEIFQEPPQYSAVKKAGRPLYDYARAGERVEVDRRRVFVEKFEIAQRLDLRRFSFRVRSAKGVYVRTLVHDLGQKLGIGAVVESLRRTQAGPFSIESAVQLSTLQYPSDIRLHLKAISAL